VVGHASLSGAPWGRNSHGFTLVELVISIVLIGILAAVGSSMISDSFTTTRLVDAATAGSGQARYALERLAREIREVKYGGSGSYCITTMTSTNLVFKKTSGTYNGTCGTNDLTVTVNGSGSALTLAYSASPAVTATLSSPVSSFSMAYYDANNTVTASTSAIRFVVITLTVTDATSGQSTAQRTRVSLRNT